MMRIEYQTKGKSTGTWPNNFDVYIVISYGTLAIFKLDL